METCRCVEKNGTISSMSILVVNRGLEKPELNNTGDTHHNFLLSLKEPNFQELLGQRDHTLSFMSEKGLKSTHHQTQH